MNRNGKICYVEFPATDIATSSRFYEQVFGWKIRNDNEGNVAFDDTIGGVSGMWVTGRPPSHFSGLLISVMVDSIETTSKAILANGGSMGPEGMDIPGMTARFTDPAGNVLGLYEHHD